MREELWQPLVGPALVRSLGLIPECIYAEVPTRDGSIADLVYTAHGRMVVFELKHAEEGQVGLGLGTRELRQLRHYKQAANAVYLVTLAAPRSYTLGRDGQTVIVEPLERQVVPEGVGWIAFDRLSIDATILVPAAELMPDMEHRQFMAAHLLARLSKAERNLQALARGVAAA